MHFAVGAIAQGHVLKSRSQIPQEGEDSGFVAMKEMHVDGHG